MDKSLTTTGNNTDDYMTAWGKDALQLIKAQVAKGASETEFQLLLYMAHKYSLDPLAKQIWCIKYGSNPAAIYTSRDGFLSIAHRSGQFDGMETKALRDNEGKLTGAACRIWRKDMSHAFVVEVALDEYISPNNGNWKTRPETMIKKVAESQCLRRAFNISGLYEPGEMDKDIPANLPQHRETTNLTVVDSDGVIVEPENDTLDETQIAFILKKANYAGMSPEQLNGLVFEQYSLTDWQRQMTKEQGKELIATLRSFVKAS